MFLFKNIHYRFSKKHVFCDLSGSILPGITVIQGKNGSGKTTLLKLLSGEYTPLHGTITFLDNPLSTYTPQALALQRAICQQSFFFPFETTVEHFIDIGISRKPHSPKKLHKLLDWVGLNGFQQRLISTLSGGQIQRMRLAKSLFQIYDESSYTPKMLFLDEPTNNLDYEDQKLPFEIAKALLANNISTCIVTHDIQLSTQYADHIFVLPPNCSSK